MVCSRINIADCLYLDIYRPPNATAASRLPVMLLWAPHHTNTHTSCQYSVHGGGFIGGGGYLPENHTGSYNGSHLSLQHNVIVVTMQYRCAYSSDRQPLIAQTKRARLPRAATAAGRVA